VVGRLEPNDVAYALADVDDRVEDPDDNTECE
jgi:hypothetical protein